MENQNKCFGSTKISSDHVSSRVLTKEPLLERYFELKNAFLMSNNFGFNSELVKAYLLDEDLYVANIGYSKSFLKIRGNDMIYIFSQSNFASSKHNSSYAKDVVIESPECAGFADEMVVADGVVQMFNASLSRCSFIGSDNFIENYKKPLILKSGMMLSDSRKEHYISTIKKNGKIFESNQVKDFYSNRKRSKLLYEFSSIYSISSKYISYDIESGKLKSKGTILKLHGIPILWSPKFTINLKGGSGILPPDISGASRQFILAIPLYLKLSNSNDLLFSFHIPIDYQSRSFQAPNEYPAMHFFRDYYFSYKYRHILNYTDRKAGFLGFYAFHTAHSVAYDPISTLPVLDSSGGNIFGVYFGLTGSIDIPLTRDLSINAAGLYAEPSNILYPYFLNALPFSKNSVSINYSAENHTYKFSIMHFQNLFFDQSRLYYNYYNGPRIPTAISAVDSPTLPAIDFAFMMRGLSSFPITTKDSWNTVLGLRSYLGGDIVSRKIGSDYYGLFNTIKFYAHKINGLGIRFSNTLDLTNSVSLTSSSSNIDMNSYVYENDGSFLYPAIMPFTNMSSIGLNFGRYFDTSSNSIDYRSLSSLLYRFNIIGVSRVGYPLIKIFKNESSMILVPEAGFMYIQNLIGTKSGPLNILRSDESGFGGFARTSNIFTNLGLLGQYDSGNGLFAVSSIRSKYIYNDDFDISGYVSGFGRIFDINSKINDGIIGYLHDREFWSSVNGAGGMILGSFLRYKQFEVQFDSRFDFKSPHIASDRLGNGIMNHIHNLNATWKAESGIASFRGGFQYIDISTRYNLSPFILISLGGHLMLTSSIGVDLSVTGISTDGTNFLDAINPLESGMIGFYLFKISRCAEYGIGFTFINLDAIVDGLSLPIVRVTFRPL